MNGYQYILEKQIQWARNQGLELIGSKITRGRPMFTVKLDQNLFRPPLMPEVRSSFDAADGNEFGSKDLPGKMQALHSSSALAVNVFQYWKSISDVPAIASACGLCRQGSNVSSDLQFEEKRPIDDSFEKHPNIDIVIHNKPDAKIKRFAIESKFSEPYGTYGHDGLKKKYLDCADIWDDIPNFRALAEKITPDDKKFKHLHAAQLIKHILAMKREFGLGGFRLLYLWYDVLGEQGKCHQDEVHEFKTVASGDGIMFHSLTYQELITSLANQQRSDHQDYIRYLTERYL